MRGVEHIPWAYDAICAFAEWRGLARWRRWLVGGARGRAPGPGCGAGRHLPLHPRPLRAGGVDPGRDGLSRARRRAPDALFVRAAAEALPFRDGVFDTVVAGLVLCSVSDPSRALAETRRVLRPDGELRALEHVRSRHPWGARAQDVIQPAWTWFAGGCHPNRDTERTVEAAGFVIGEDGRRAQGTMRRFAARLAARKSAGTMGV